MLKSRRTWLIAVVWLVSRALLVAEVGFWHHSGHYSLEDVAGYQHWSGQLANGTLPGGHAWQYPPGAAFLMLAPRVGPWGYGQTFVGLMLAFDLLALGLLCALSAREENWTGVWVWLFGLPFIGVFSILRFDLVPTTIAIAALVVIHRRPHWFGALAGIGAAIKLWPVVLLFGERDRHRLGRATRVAVSVAAVVGIIAAIAFGDPFGALSAQSGRGLQEEAVATAPWQLVQVVTGERSHRSLEYGAWQIDTPAARTLAGVLDLLSLAVLAAAAWWWWRRGRAIARGDEALAGADVSRDFVFTVVLLLVVTSRVLSPQYMVWLLGLAAVVLSASRTRLTRPAWMTAGAVLLTTVTFRTPTITLLRDLALLAAGVDAALAMVLATAERPAAAAPLKVLGHIPSLSFHGSALGRRPDVRQPEVIEPDQVGEPARAAAPPTGSAYPSKCGMPRKCGRQVRENFVAWMAAAVTGRRPWAGCLSREQQGHRR